MSSELDRLIRTYARRGVALDSNVLLLYVAGTHDEWLLDSFKRVSGFGREGFSRLQDLVAPFARLWTTPHVLTEVNGHANQLPDWIKPEFNLTFRALIHEAFEIYTPATSLAEVDGFLHLGLTDASLVALASEKDPLVVSTDAPLVLHLMYSGSGALNFNHYLDW